MQDFRNRLGRTFSIFVTLYLIQALSLSTVYAAVIDSSFSSVSSTKKGAGFSVQELGFGVASFFSNVTSLKISHRDIYFNNTSLITPLAVKTPLFANFINANNSQKEISNNFVLLSSQKRNIDVAGSGIVPPSFGKLITKATDSFSSRVFSKNLYVAKNTIKNYDFIVPTISKVKTSYLKAYGTFLLTSKTASAASSSTAVKSKIQSPLFDKVSLNFYCYTSSLFSSLDNDRCNYEKVLLGIKREATSTPESGLAQTPVIINQPTNNTTVYVSTSTVTYITKYVNVPGPKGKDGKDGKDGKVGLKPRSKERNLTL
jgi:hypothetical protein